MFSRGPTESAPKGKKAGKSDPLASLFCDISSEWDRAEEVIKLAEQVTYDVVIPAIMELRYAGRRLVDALNCHAAGGADDKVAAFLEDARFSCHRAKHDAIDAALSLMAIESDRIARQAGYDVVHNSYPDFVNFLERLDEARMCIVESRRYRNDRDKIYSAISVNDFPGLVQDFKALRRSRTTMEIIIGRKKLGIALGVVATIAVALPGYVLSWYFWEYPRVVPPPPHSVVIQHNTPPPTPHLAPIQNSN